MSIGALNALAHITCKIFIKLRLEDILRKMLALVNQMK